MEKSNCINIVENILLIALHENKEIHIELNEKDNQTLGNLIRNNDRGLWIRILPKGESESGNPTMEEVKDIFLKDDDDEDDERGAEDGEE